MPDTNGLEALKEELAELAERVAREAFSVELDYSVESVRRVEELLGRMHEEYRRSKSDEGLRGLALEFAAYMIKVIERNFSPGRWARDHADFGPDSFPYEWQGRELFPYAWCQKRIFDGPGDDVWAKFQALVVDEAS